MLKSHDFGFSVFLLCMYLENYNCPKELLLRQTVTVRYIAIRLVDNLER